MKKQTPLVEENKKRAAFKRFSQMSAAGLAVISISAFTQLSAKQLPANMVKNVVKEQNATVENRLAETVVTKSIVYGNGHNEYNNYSDHTDYNNYSNYSNNYANECNNQN